VSRRRTGLPGKPKEACPPSWRRAKGRPAPQEQLPEVHRSGVPPTSGRDPIRCRRPKRHRSHNNHQRLPPSSLLSACRKQGRSSATTRRFGHHHPSRASRSQADAVALPDLAGPGPAGRHQLTRLINQPHPGPRRTRARPHRNWRRRPRSSRAQARDHRRSTLRRPRPPHRRRGSRGLRPNPPFKVRASLRPLPSPLPGRPTAHQLLGNTAGPRPEAGAPVRMRIASPGAPNTMRRAMIS